MYQDFGTSRKYSPSSRIGQYVATVSKGVPELSKNSNRYSLHRCVVPTDLRIEISQKL